MVGEASDEPVARGHTFRPGVEVSHIRPKIQKTTRSTSGNFLPLRRRAVSVPTRHRVLKREIVERQLKSEGEGFRESLQSTFESFNSLPSVLFCFLIS